MEESYLNGDLPHEDYRPAFEPRNIIDVIAELKEITGLPEAVLSGLENIESRERYNAPELQRQAWDVLQVLLEDNLTPGHPVAKRARAIFNDTENLRRKDRAAGGEKWKL